MNISHFTVRKQIAFELPQPAADALRRVEQARRSILDVFPLRSNLALFEDVSNFQFGPETSALVYADFAINDQDETPSLDDAAHVIAIHAEDAMSIETFLPDYATADGYKITVLLGDGLSTVVTDDRHRRLVHVDEHFIVTSPTHSDGLSIHFLRNGHPSAVEIEATDEIIELFRDVVNANHLHAADHAVLATRHLDTVRDWVRSVIYVPALEAEFAQEQIDLSEHSLGGVISMGGKSVVYYDDDLIITRSRNDLVAHFENDGAYGVKIFKDVEAQEVARLINVQGLVSSDDDNPVREWLRERVAFDQNIVPSRTI